MGGKGGGGGGGGHYRPGGAGLTLSACGGGVSCGTAAPSVLARSLGLGMGPGGPLSLWRGGEGSLPALKRWREARGQLPHRAGWWVRRLGRHTGKPLGGRGKLFHV